MTFLAAWHNLPHAERVARLRWLQGLVRAFVGLSARDLVALLRAAEADPGVLPRCGAALADISAVPLRRILETIDGLREACGR